MRSAALFYLCAIAELSAAQQIWDIWQTTWNRSSLFKSLKPRYPFNFTDPSPVATANIIVNETTTYQSIVGFGGSLTDSSALHFSTLKAKNATSYDKLLTYLFSAKEGANAAGLSYLRLPMGASDFSAKQYSYDDANGDTCMNQVDVGVTPSYVYTVLQDILAVNPAIKIHVVPWSPPGWMKTTGTMNGGTLKSTMIDIYATYLLKSLQSLKRKGVEVYAISIQNEPLYSNPTYPTSTLTAANEAKIGKQLKALMKANGFPSVKLIGYDHNWSSATDYAVNLMKAAPDTFDGVAFHCYSGSVSQQGAFHKLYPKKEIYFTECSGVFGTDWWNDIKWDTENIFIGAVENNAKTALMWNLALDGAGSPKYPGTNSCGGPGCRGVVTIDSNGSWSVNQEFYAMAHVSKATIPRDIGGPSGKRIKVTIGGSLSWALRVSAFMTGRIKTTDWNRYSMVVMNYDDSVGGWNPTPVTATIAFRGKQAKYTFPVGLTTLWWYSPALNSTTAMSGAGVYAIADCDGAQTKLELIDVSELTGLQVA